MYFAYGWPRVFCGIAQDATSTGSDDPDEIVELHLDSEYCVVLSKRVIQIWTGGKNRVRLGQMARDAGSLEQLGTNVAGVWSSSRHQLAVLSSKGFLLLYGIRITKDTVLYTQSPVARGAPIELKGVTLYLQYCIPVEGADENLCHELVADSRTIIVACGDAVLQAYSWQGKLRGKGSPLPYSMHFTHSGLFPSPSVPADVARGGLQGAHSFPMSTAASFPVGNAASFPLPPLAPASSYPRSTMGRRVSDPNIAGQPGDSSGGPMVLRSMDYAPRIKLVAMVVHDGRVGICRVPDDGLHPLEQWSFSHWVCGPGSGGRYARICEAGQLVAVGMVDGTVHLFPLHASRQPVAPAPLRVLSLQEWGHDASMTGEVARMRWSPDGHALAVGFSRAGQVVWSPSGCRLMCTLRQGAGGGGGGPHAASRMPSMDRESMERMALESSQQQAEGGSPAAPLPPESGICALAWGPYGYQLMVAESGDASSIRELSFAKSLGNSHRVLHSGRGGASQPLALAQQEEAVHVLQADDRLLLILEEQRSKGGGRSDEASGSCEPGLMVQHLLVPLHYIAANYPVMKAAVSADGMDVAVAGRHGVALYSRRSQRWRVFGDISQERQIRVEALVWLPRVIVVCAQVAAMAGGSTSGGSGVEDHAAAQLLLYPRYHLDNSSLLARYPLAQAPTAMDAVGSYLLLASEPLDLTLLHVSVEGHLAPTGSPRAVLSVVRELSIMSVGQPLRDIALVAPQAPDDGERGLEPRLCVLQRCGGAFGVLDLVDGSESPLAPDVECFWLPAAPVWKGSDAKAAASVAAPLKSSVSFTRSTLASGSTEAVVAAAAAASSGGLRRGVTDTTIEASSTSSPATSPFSPAARAGAASGGAAGGFGGGQGGVAVAGQGGDVEMPWWTYGARGMQLWFPSNLGASSPLVALRGSHLQASGRPGSAGSNASGGGGGGGLGSVGSGSPGMGGMVGAGPSTDPELEFDKEVYPIGISFSEVAIIGITQRTVRGLAISDSPVSAAGSANGSSSHLQQLQQHSSGYEHAPCFHPLPESQPVLPCLLRRLLQQGRAGEALALARKHSGAPHFPRSLEWLLFTTLEMDAEQFMQKLNRWKAVGQPLQLAPENVPLVTAAAQLLRAFPRHFPDIAVRVARKTDSVLWPVLFEAVGPPSGLLQALMSSGSLQTAACCLIIVDSIEGNANAHAQALRLIRAALAVGRYDLCAELARYLLPPGEAEVILHRVYGERLQQLQRLAGGSGNGRGEGDGTVGGVQSSDAPSTNEDGSWSMFAWFWSGGGTSGSAAAAAANGIAPPPPSASRMRAGRSCSGGSPGQPVSPHAQPRGGGGGSFSNPKSPRFDESLAVMAQAWQIIGRHALQLLEQGRLRELANLGSAFAHMGAGLSGLLAAGTPDPSTSPIKPPSAMATASALAVAAGELLPDLVRDLDTAADATFLLDSLAWHPGCVPWAIALAVLLHDEETLHGVKQRFPELWGELLAVVQRDTQLKAHAAALQAVEERPAENGANGQPPVIVDAKAPLE